ncbi:MAG TPA: hypothetical protein ENI07_12905 [Desulfobacterales bacterium]|nr:hypothetical protein [Desulfobacterales bacterium]
MSNFCPDQGRTRICGEAYVLYAATKNPRRTPSRAKKVIYGWTLARAIPKIIQHRFESNSETIDLKKAQSLGAGKYIKKQYTMGKIEIVVKEELEK